MKAKKLAALLLTLVLALGLISVGAMAEQRPVAPDSTASITVNNAVANDVFAAYKVVDITYNAGNNTLTKTWNTNFAGYFTGTTVEQFAALKNDPEQLKSLLAGLPQYIKDNPSITPVKEATAAADKSATFAGLDMGEYFIRPTSTTSVYQLMLQKIEPTVANVGGVQTYVIDDVDFNAKHKEVTVAKSANKTSVTKKEKVEYTITVDIPTYLDEAKDKTFYVSDKLPDGLTIDTGSIKVQVGGGDVAAGAYTLDTTKPAEYTFKLSVSNDQYANWKTNAGINPLVITYTATLNDNDTTEVNEKETNTVTFDYSNYPYVDSHVTKTAKVDVTTFAIKVNKVDASNNETKLANAEFDLYRTIYPGETENVVTIPHANVQGVKLESGITGADGTYTFEKYEANGDKYKYYLVETQAPSGYNLLNDAIEVKFTDTDVDANGVYTVGVANNSGIQLPVTGGMGTVIFTVIGIALMAGAVVLLVLSRKKATVNK